MSYLGNNWGKTNKSKLLSRVITTQNHVINDYDNYTQYLIDASLFNVNLVLPAANIVGNGFILQIKKIDSSDNKVTITAVIGQNIDGNVSYELTAFSSGIGIISDGFSWKVYSQIGVDASETAIGITRLATETEALALESPNVALTPFTLGKIIDAYSGAGYNLNDYVVFSNGLILQWGQVNIQKNTNSGTTVNFPITFPNTVLQGYVSAGQPAGDGSNPSIFNLTNSTASFAWQAHPSGASVYLGRYFVIGY